MDDSTKVKAHSKELFFLLSTIVTLITTINILALSIYIFMIAGPIPALIAFAALMYLFLINSFHYVDPRVPHKWMPMIFGKFANHLGDPGWIFIPFKGLLFLNYVLMYGGEIERVFDVQEVIPGDRSNIKIPVDIYISILNNNPAQIIEVGGLEAAITRLQNIIIQRLRYWITSPVEGPQTMDQARQMRDEAINAIVEALLRDDIRRIPSEIPTEVLYGIYKNRTLSPKEQELKAKQYDPLPENEKEEIMTATAEHIEIIRSAREGHFPIPLQYLGLEVRRFGVNNIEPAGSTVENVAMVNKAKFEAEKRKADAQGIADAAKIFTEIPGYKGNALKDLQVSEGLVKETINTTRYEASPEILVLAGTILGPIGVSLAEKLGRKE